MWIITEPTACKEKGQLPAPTAAEDTSVANQDTPTGKLTGGHQTEPELLTPSTADQTMEKDVIEGEFSRTALKNLWGNGFPSKGMTKHGSKSEEILKSSPAVKSGEVLIKKDGTINKTCSAVRQGKVVFKKDGTISRTGSELIQSKALETKATEASHIKSFEVMDAVFKKLGLSATKSEAEQIVRAMNEDDNLRLKRFNANRTGASANPSAGDRSLDAVIIAAIDAANETRNSKLESREAADRARALMDIICASGGKMPERHIKAFISIFSKIRDPDGHLICRKNAAIVTVEEDESRRTIASSYTPSRAESGLRNDGENDLRTTKGKQREHRTATGLKSDGTPDLRTKVGKYLAAATAGKSNTTNATPSTTKYGATKEQHKDDSDARKEGGSLASVKTVLFPTKQGAHHAIPVDKAVSPPPPSPPTPTPTPAPTRSGVSTGRLGQQVQQAGRNDCISNPPPPPVPKIKNARVTTGLKMDNTPDMRTTVGKQMAAKASDIATKAAAREAEAARVRAKEAEAARVRAREAEAARVRAREAEAARVRAREAEAARIRAREAEASERRAQQQQAAAAYNSHIYSYAAMPSMYTPPQHSYSSLGLSSGFSFGGTPNGYYSSNGSANGSQLYTGPRGGTYYINGNGNRSYI